MQVASGDDILDMPLETYITCVLAGEMPVSFEMEALKAQAVAIRTYTLRTVMKSGKHSPAQICTDPACCQAFSNPDSSSDAEKLRAAVQQTQGLVLMYGGELIDATYFSCSGGRTEAALEVYWKLVSLPSRSVTITVKVTASAGAAVFLPQAARAKSMTNTRSREIILFIVFLLISRFSQAGVRSL